jgi:predicted O-linked N-acetylglucosamine transferase (SPINDLY family)
MEESAGWARRAITFCSLNDFGKINRFSLRLWARVLTRVKNSRLILLSSIGGHRDQTIKLLEREGVQANRVEFVARRPRTDYLRLYQRMDIALDPFPYGGHTTSLDALWMGVPVVSLAGERPVSRGGLSILNNLGLPELVTFSEDEFVNIAVNLATDLPRLAELRRTLRSRMEKSVLMNGPHFARQIEAAYRAIWRDWCARPEQPSSPVPSSDHRLS